MEGPTWSKNQLRRLGEHIRDGTTPGDVLPDYEDVMLWFNDLASHVQLEIRNLDWLPLLGERRRPSITSRPKTIDTLRQKLQRDRATPLPSIQDVAGVRFEAEMSLDEQDAVVRAIGSHFGVPPDKIKDLRGSDDAHSGYRAVHLWLNLPGLARVEVQVRTHLQGMWANTYEALADVAGRGIRYGEFPEDEDLANEVREMQSSSTQLVSNVELLRSQIAGTDARLAVLRRRVGLTSADQQAIKKLEFDSAKVQTELASLEVEMRGFFAHLETRLRAQFTEKTK